MYENRTKKPAEFVPRRGEVIGRMDFMLHAYMSIFV
jgi:hypothetical protein